ncbi:hypothetical protein Pyn_11624 [Prunus yedoensis var. nudiflora]|uniref:Uncharacterized protein n=1 Tax=Prunus yedoensis var. nudiflora TaxID=2094558 RepID=A0A314XFJ6_PRUYE|nr:hypothetical protein Pyn_11624 [Prunus yedoensis var. nudiflora]
MSSAGAEVESFKDHSPMSSEVDASSEDVSYARPSLYGNLGPIVVVELESSEAEQSQNVGATDHIDSEP